MKKLSYLALTLLFLTTAMTVLPLPKASASVNYNRLIDDSVFNYSSSMNAAQIDSFLNSFSSSCISTNKGFKAPDPTGYNPSDGFLYGSNVSAGTVIYDAAQAYDINPRVLLATIQKEQTYVSGPGTYSCSDPLSASARKGYSQIVGYGCPDGGTTHDYSGLNLYTIGSTTVTSVNGTCVNSSQKVGFSQQIIHGAWLLKFGQQRSLGNTNWSIVKGAWNNSDDPDFCYGGPMTQGYRKRCSSDPSTTYYDGYTTIDGTSVHMDTGGTATLYWYTPHLSGNTNFENIYSSWFGSPFVNTGGDKPFVGDWNNAGKETMAFRRNNQYYFDYNNDGNADCHFAWARATDTLLVGDWDGDGKNNIGIKRGNTYYLDTNCSPGEEIKFTWGQSTDIPLVGDFNGDGKADIALKRGNMYFYDFNKDGHEETAFYWGNSSDTPLVGDWDGDGKDEIGLRRVNTWFIDNDNDGSIARNSAAHADIIIVWGDSSDGILIGDWDGDGKDNIGIRRGNAYYLDTDFVHGEDIPAFSMGQNGDKVRVGDWDGDGKDSIGVKEDSHILLDNNYDGRADKDYVYLY